MGFFDKLGIFRWWAQDKDNIRIPLLTILIIFSLTKLL